MSAPDVEPIWQLVEQAAADLEPPIRSQDFIEWFAEAHPDVPEPTLRAHLSALAGNSRAYLNHPYFSRRPPILWRVGWGVYEPYEPDRHGPPIAVDEDGDVADLSNQPRPPVWQLLREATRELPSPFAAQAMLDWFGEHYPDIPSATIRTQMSDWAANSPAFIFHPARDRRVPVLWRVERGVYEAYDPTRHGDVTAVGADLGDGADEDVVEAAQEFVLEQYLEQFLSDNWTRVAFGRALELWSPDERSPRQFDVGPIGRLDFLCRDPTSDALVVVELKRGTPSDAVVGQILRYMAWVKENVARDDQAVEGVIIVGDADDRLQYAVSMVPALRVLTYRIDFRLEALG